MRVLITGADGFVGRRLAERLRGRGAEVVAAGRARLDVSDAAQVRAAVRAAPLDALVHLAAVTFVPDAEADALRAWRVNYLGTHHVLAAVAADAPRARVLLVSSSLVYGSAAPGAAPFREDAPLRPGNAYARTKAAADLLGAAFAARGLAVWRAARVRFLTMATKKKTRAARPRKKAASPAAMQGSHAEFMVRAYQMELDAEARYTMLAEQMETHNNAAVAELFRKLSRIEGKHAKKILEQMKWKSLPALPVAFGWQGFESPEAVPADEPHYLMQPWHALKLAEHNEQRAVEFFERFAAARVPADVRAAALEMAGEEREHVRLIGEWLAKVSPPEPGWDEDMDPPAVAD